MPAVSDKMQLASAQVEALPAYPITVSPGFIHWENTDLDPPPADAAGMFSLSCSLVTGWQMWWPVQTVLFCFGVS